jgi:hypothetical protein
MPIKKPNLKYIYTYDKCSDPRQKDPRFLCGWFDEKGVCRWDGMKPCKPLPLLDIYALHRTDDLKDLKL